MLTGWFPKFEMGRGISDAEKRDRLVLGVSDEFTPNDSTSLISLNSTYADFIDRTFSMKGFAPTLATGILSIFSIMIAVYAVITIMPASPSVADVIAALFLFGVVGGLVYFFWHVVLGHDLFSYRYYPVRFNRMTKKIYVFRGRRTGGELVLPWGGKSLFFHIGRGTQNKALCDLRCHVLDKNGLIVDTFTVGVFVDDPIRIRERWEFINRYMEGGGGLAAPQDVDKIITLSVKNSLVNSYRWSCFLLGRSLFPFRYILFPLYGSLALTRWLVMATCAIPRFSAATEVESEFDPDDGGRWFEPEFIDQFGQRPDVVARTRELYRERQRRQKGV